MLNGADGLGEIAAGLVGQGLSIFESIKSNLNDYDDEEDELGEGPALSPPQLSGSPAPPADGAGRAPVDPDTGPTHPTSPRQGT